MVIVNADDWGRSCIDTDAALTCFSAGRITSVSAMVFMEDSERAATIAKDAEIDVGLHLNLSQLFTGECRDRVLREYHERIVRFLTSNKYAVLLYNPFLRKHFRYVYHSQVEEFLRLYGKPPTHIDGHHHKHLCANMLLDNVIPAGEKVRRNFTFGTKEKSLINRTYRGVVDRWLACRYSLTDFFYALPHCFQAGRASGLVDLPDRAKVEIMTHPARADEYASLMSHEYFEMISKLEMGTYSSL
jgi:chitin disaccharide deacetylase